MTNADSDSGKLRSVMAAASTVSDITREQIFLIVQAIVSIMVIGTYLISLITQHVEIAQTLEKVVLGLLAFWFGQSALTVYHDLTSQKVQAQIEIAKAQNGKS